MAQKISLLDFAKEDRVVEWWVAFHPRTPHFFWAAWLKQGFRHVEMFKPYYYGPTLRDCVWLVFRPNFEILENHIEFDPTPPWERYPEATFVRVKVLVKSWRVRQWFHFGPPSCVESVKNALGISKFWIRTPYQLYKFLKRRGGVLGV